MMIYHIIINIFAHVVCGERETVIYFFWKNCQEDRTLIRRDWHLYGAYKIAPCCLVRQSRWSSGHQCVRTTFSTTPSLASRFVIKRERVSQCPYSPRCPDRWCGSSDQMGKPNDASAQQWAHLGSRSLPCEEPFLRLSLWVKLWMMSKSPELKSVFWKAELGADHLLYVGVELLLSGKPSSK